MEQNPEFCTGVQIILKRMESNPEEFNVGGGNYGKWGRILEQVVIVKEAGSDKLPFPNHLNGITAAEINAIYDGYCKFLRKRFDDYVMKEIFADAKELSSSMTSAPNVVLGNSGLGGSALNSTTTGFHNTAVGYQAPYVSNANYTLTIGKTSLNEEDIETIKRRVL
jgi:hypothetical protein